MLEFPRHDDPGEWRRRKREQWWQETKDAWGWPPEWPNPIPGCLIVLAILFLISLIICG